MGTLSLYLDTSALVPLLLTDPLSTPADRALRGWQGPLIASDLGIAEFASAASLRVRIGQLAPDEARQAFLDIDAFVAGRAHMANVLGSDMAAAISVLRRLDLTLRAPDAIHIAIAQRLGATLLTFDAKMAAAAQVLGCPVLAG